MNEKRAFERRYSLNVASLKEGKQEEGFEIDRSFFEEFEQSLSQDGELKVHLDIDKRSTHLDVHFSLRGWVEVPCDRCAELYRQPVDSKHRIVYSFDEDLDFDGYEVMHVKAMESHLVLVQELYDFIQLSLPLRRVPPRELHHCDPEVLKVLGLDEEGNELEAIEEKDKDTDPRWDALKKLKNT